MGASLALFFLAYALRKSNNTAHRALAVLGVVFNLASSVYLIYAVRIKGIEMLTSYPVAVATAHRAFATLMAIMMLLMLMSGIRRKRNLHIALHRIFLPGYTLTYFSGLVIFHA
jgi:uncharacterized protein with PQ loop repeat